MNEKFNKAQIGIGTLIVFIALVLVAAIAAGVLINSADLLQERGESTSEDSVSEVSDQIVVTSTLGTVLNTTKINKLDSASDINNVEGYSGISSNSTQTVQGYPFNTDASPQVTDGGAVFSGVTSGNVETQIIEVKLNVRTASGADEIDLREATIDFLGKDDATLVYSDSALDPRNTTGANHGEDFVVDGLSGSNFATILRGGDRAQITLGLLEENVSDGYILKNEIGFDEGLAAGETAELHLITNGGAETFVQINVPETLNQDAGETVSV